MKSTLFALLLLLLLPAMNDASAKPSRPGASNSSSFKSGFSSQRAASTSGSERAPSAGPSFGAFGGARRGAARQPSESVLSQRLSQDAAQANALRTLDARRAADQARTAVPPAPSLDRGQLSPSTMQLPAPAPIIVHQSSSGLGNIVTGFLLGRAMSGGHDHHSATANYGNGPVATTAGQQGSFFGSVLRMIAWLAILALMAWAGWSIWKFLRRGQAPGNANYSFER